MDRCHPQLDFTKMYIAEVDGLGLYVSLRLGLTATALCYMLYYM